MVTEELEREFNGSWAAPDAVLKFAQVLNIWLALLLVTPLPRSIQVLPSLA